MHKFLIMSMVCIAGCTSTTVVDEMSPREYGSKPELVTPKQRVLPIVRPAKAVGFGAAGMPVAAAGWRVNRFAENLQHPRWMLELPNGDVLVAETDSPEGSGGFSGLQGALAKAVMRYAGSGLGSPNRIVLLRDQNGDGRADLQKVLLTDLHSPFGMAFLNGYLYVANTDSLVRFPYDLGAESITAGAEILAPLPALPLNHHWTKSLIADSAGEFLYIGVGSNSNIGENGIAVEYQRAAILRYELETQVLDIFADGLRNPVGLAWHPDTDVLWTVVNERDELGDQLVPDYLTAVNLGDFYGWPAWYMGQRRDPRVGDEWLAHRAEVVQTPDYAVGAHTASLGLDFYDQPHPTLKGAAIIGQHGSWNRSQYAGYQVIAVPFVDGQPAGAPETVLSGFIGESGQALGRPVGVDVLSDGAILVADDVANVIWRLVPSVGCLDNVGFECDSQ